MALVIFGCRDVVVPGSVIRRTLSRQSVGFKPLAATGMYFWLRHPQRVRPGAVAKSLISDLTLVGAGVAVNLN